MDRIPWDIYRKTRWAEVPLNEQKWVPSQPGLPGPLRTVGSRHRVGRGPTSRPVPVTLSIPPH